MACQMRLQFHRSVACIALIFMGLTGSIAFSNDEYCPPYGTRMPPDELEVVHGLKRAEWDDYPAYWSAYLGEVEGRGMISLGVSKRFRRVGEPTDFEWGWMWNIPDQSLVMISGQIYRCGYASKTFTRIPDHPLSLAPKDSLRFFAIPTTAGLMLSDLQDESRHIHVIRLTTIEFDREQQTLNEPGKARLKLTLDSDHRLLSPQTSTVDDTTWVRSGQYIETTRWILQVTRIVFPDSKQGIEGWVEVRVEQTRTPKNRPPAPSLPESPAAQLPEIPSEPIRQPADRPPAPRLPQNPAPQWPPAIPSALCPPIGTQMPPDLFQFKSKRYSTGYKLEDYPAEVSIDRNKQGEWSEILLSAHAQTPPPDFDDFSWDWGSDVKDGHVLMIGGQIYRCDTKAMTLTRIPNHRLSLAPKDAVRILAVYPRGHLSVAPPIFGPRAEKPSIDVGLYLLRFDPGAKSATSPGRAELKMIIVEPVDPDTDEVEQVAWVRVGDSIKTAHGSLKVTRIVFPNPDEGIDGWVEVYVTPPRPTANREPRK